MFAMFHVCDLNLRRCIDPRKGPRTKIFLTLDRMSAAARRQKKATSRRSVARRTLITTLSWEKTLVRDRVKPALKLLEQRNPVGILHDHWFTVRVRDGVLCLLSLELDRGRRPSFDAFCQFHTMCKTQELRRLSKPSLQASLKPASVASSATKTSLFRKATTALYEDSCRAM